MTTATNLRTDQPTVILPYGARHIFDGENHTLCNLTVDDRSAVFPAVAGQRISCGLCAQAQARAR